MNTTIHIIEQWKGSLLMLTIINTLSLVKKSIIKVLHFKLVIMLEYQKTKTVLLIDALQIGLKKFLQFKFFVIFKLKTQSRGHMLLMIFMVKRFLELFMKENCKKQTQKNLG